MRKSKLNLIMNSVVLFMTTVLLVISVFAWYATNKQVSVTGGKAVTAPYGYGFIIEVWDKEEAEWVEIEDFSEMSDKTKDLWPNDIIYFRVYVDSSAPNSTGDIDISMKLSEIECVVDSDKITSDGSKVAYEGVPVYDVSSKKVQVTVNDTTKTLYNVANDNTVTLGDLLIKNAVYIDSNPTMSSGTGLAKTPIATSPVGLSGSTLTAIESTTITGTVTTTSAKYFALYYKDGAFTKATGISKFAEGTTYYTYSVANGYTKVSKNATFNSGTTYYTVSGEDPNVDYYQYQIMSIHKFTIEVE